MSDDGHPHRVGGARVRRLQPGLQRGVQLHVVVLPPPSVRRRPATAGRPTVAGGLGRVPRVQPAVRPAGGQGGARGGAGPGPGLPPGPDGFGPGPSATRPADHPLHPHSLRRSVGAAHAADRGGRRADGLHGRLRSLRIPHRAVGLVLPGRSGHGVGVDRARGPERTHVRVATLHRSGEAASAPRPIPRSVGPWPESRRRSEAPTDRSSYGWTGWNCRRTSCAGSGPSTSCWSSSPSDGSGWSSWPWPTPPGRDSPSTWPTRTRSSPPWSASTTSGGRPGWTPIVLEVEDDYPRSLAALTRYDVLLVNPVRDGLNLVAKEGPLINTRNGVLALSREAGAFDELASGVARGQSVRCLRHRRGDGRGPGHGTRAPGPPGGTAPRTGPRPPPGRLAPGPTRRRPLVGAPTASDRGPIRIRRRTGPSRKRSSFRDAGSLSGQPRQRLEGPGRPGDHHIGGGGHPVIALLVDHGHGHGVDPTSGGQGSAGRRRRAGHRGRPRSRQAAEDDAANRRTTDPLSTSRGGRSSTDIRPGWARSPDRSTSVATAPVAHPAASGARRQWTVTASPLGSTRTPRGASRCSRATEVSTTWPPLHRCRLHHDLAVAPRLLEAVQAHQPHPVIPVRRPRTWPGAPPERHRATRDHRHLTELLGPATS